MNSFVLCGLIFAAVCLSPLLLYLAAKLWAFGTMRGKQAYREWKDKQKPKQTKET